MTKTKAPRRLTARSADRHDLYQQSVQHPEGEVKFYNRRFQEKTGRRPRVLREDFCGAALLCCHWVDHRADNRAVGVDLDASVLAWGRTHNFPAIGDAAQRITLLNQNVLEVKARKFDVACALNFSYWTFQDRDTLRRYFANVRASLIPEGIFFMDCYGGPEAHREMEERRRLSGFTYVWRQARFDPIHSRALNFIDFEFPDGTQQRAAFRYEWRLWTLPELHELLAEAGFSRVEVWWEGTEANSRGGNGVYRRVKTAPADDSWISYLIAHR